jgi:hypothetical protein
MLVVKRLHVPLTRCLCGTVRRCQHNNERPVDAKLHRIAASHTRMRTLINLSQMANSAALRRDVKPGRFARHAAFHATTATRRIAF